MKSRLYFILVLAFLSACTSEFKPAYFNSVVLDNSFEADIAVIYDVAQGNTELSTTINANITEAILANISRDSTTSDLQSSLKVFNTEYLNFIRDFPDVSEPKWELQIETEVVYQSDDLITIAISTYMFQGGAHGNDYITLLNLDATNGNILQHADFIKDMEGFKVLAQNHFIKNLDNKEEHLAIDDFFFGEAFHLPENIGFSEDGIVLLYNVYEVASYAQGYTEFAIPYNEAEAYLKMN